jgi:hypothetical protein
MLHLVLYIGNLTEGSTQYVPWGPAGDFEFPLITFHSLISYNLIQHRLMIVIIAYVAIVISN